MKKIKQIKQIMSVIMIISFVLSIAPVSFGEIKEVAPSLAPLQERLNRDAQLSEFEQDEIISDGSISAEEQAILDEINNNIISTDVDQSETDATVSDVESQGNIDEIAITDTVPVEVQESELELMSASSTSISDGFKVEPVGSVYNVLNNNNDYVSQATGALTYEKNLLSLPGANGLDLNLSVRYSSNDAVITQNEFADTNETVRKINFNSFAVGWSFGFPTIVKSNVKQNYGWKKETNLTFPDGSGYTILNDIENPTADTALTLQFYKLSDMTLVKKADTNNYELKYSDGTVYTFDSTYGNLIKIKDIYNNEINFYYTELDYNRGSFLDYIFNPSYYSAKINALTKIVDTAGREINIDYIIDKTAYGKEVKQIKIKMDGTSYAILKLERVPNYEGVADVLSQIIDGEGNITKYNYDEKITHIYYRNPDDASSPSYTVNGSVFALTSVNLPTGGRINYDYIKSRRAYVYYIPAITYCDWYEVYKVSKVSDSSGFERSYEYENDRSGYPHSYLDVEPTGYEGYTTYTGNVENSAFRYFCLVRENGKTTVSTFDYQHNKIKEQIYEDNNTQNSYIAGNGRTKWSVMIGDYIYHMGYTNAYSEYTANRTFLYKQNIHNGEIILLTAYSEPIMSSTQVKSYGDNILIFFKTGSGNDENPYKLVTKSYDTTTDLWSDAGEIELPETIGRRITLQNLYYSNNTFFCYTTQNLYSATNTLYHVVYDPQKSDVNERWFIKDSASVFISGYPDSTFSLFCLNGSKIYYIDSNSFIEYDFTTDTATERANKLSDSLMDTLGFTYGGKTYAFGYRSIVEFSYADGTANATYDLPDSLTYSGFFVQKGTDGNIYLIRKNQNTSYNCPVYRFEPNSSGEKFALIGNLLVNPVITSNPPILFAGSNCLYMCGDGVEKIKLSEPEVSQSTNLVAASYNEYNQPVQSTVTRISGSGRRDGGSQSYTYLNGKSVITSSTDILGNKTCYEYTDSPYYIPTKVTKYSGTENELETTFTLSSDKTKVVSTETFYDDITLKTTYIYGDSAKPGNVTSENLYETVPGSNEYSLVLQKDYVYDESKTQIISTTQKNVRTNDSNFTLAPAQDITVSQKYNSLGLVTAETDALGRTTHYGYNKNGWQTWIVYPDGTTTDIYYHIDGANGGENTITTVQNESYVVIDYFDDLGRQILQSEKHIDGSEAVLLGYSYDGHNVNMSIDGVGNSNYYNYDAFDRVTGLTQYDSDDILYCDIKVTFNDFNLARTVDNSGKTSKTYYDIAGRLIKEETATDAGLAVVHNFYDYMGNINKTISPKNEDTIYSYNSRGLLAYVTDSTNSTVSYQYDAQGNPLTVTNAGQLIQTNTYDELGRVLTVTDAMGLTQMYQYDNGGRVVKSKDRNGQTTNYTYKANTDYLENQTTGSMVLDYTYDSFGNVLTASNYTGTYEYSYKYNNLLESVKTPDEKTISYSYDNNHNIVRIDDYSGDTITYSYNGMNMIDSVRRNGNPVAEYDYYMYGALKKISYPGQGTGEFAYDNAMRLISQTNSLSDGTVVNSYSYAYDLNGNQIQKIDNGNVTRYSYDSIGRLSNVSEPDGTSTSYTFDTRGNIMTKTVEHPSSYEFAFRQSGQDFTLTNVATHEFTYAYDKNNRLKYEGEYIGGSSDNYTGFLEITKYSEYDNNGNLLKTTTGGQIDEMVTSYSYNPLNQLSQYTDAYGNATNYYYTHDGLRSSKKQNGMETKYYWDGTYVSAESVNGEITAKNYIGAGGIFARGTESGMDYMFKNGHGDVTGLVSNGAVNQTYSYDAYGTQKNANSNDTNPLGYSGEYQDLCSGLIYLRNRYYDPSIGRFITEDLARDGLNWYVYCENNPVNRIDPLGLESYVFYTTGKNSDFSSQAQWQKDRLGNMGEKVIMIPVTDVKTFEDGWNGMGMVDGKSVDINYVMIYTHGNHRSMIFESGSSTKAMSINGKNSSGGKIGNVNDLQEKEIKELNLLSCNAGNLLTYYNEKENLASVLSKKVINGNTYAYDGNVSFGKSPWDIFGKDIGKSSRLATNQHGFNEIAKKYNVSGRKPLGKITYYNGEYKPYGYYPNTSIWAN